MPTYDQTTQTGYRNPVLPVVPGSTAGNGVAVGSAAKVSNDAPVSHPAFRWDSSRNPATKLDELVDGSGAQAYAINTVATELGNLGTDASGDTNSQAYAINDAGVAVGYALLPLLHRRRR